MQEYIYIVYWIYVLFSVIHIYKVFFLNFKGPIDPFLPSNF